MIRKMDMSDVAFVYELEKEAFGKSLEKPMLTNEILYNDMAQYFVLIIDGKRLGYAGIWITKPNAEVINIAVRSEEKSKGYGKALMQKIIDTCHDEGVKDLTLEVSEKKEDVIAFYQSFGFEIKTTRQHYYSDGSHAYLMVKQIGGKQ